MSLVFRLFLAEQSKTWRTRFPYLGLAASALAALVARQSGETFGRAGELTASRYLTMSVNISTTAIIPIFATVFAAGLVAGEVSKRTHRLLLPRPVSRSQFLTAKLLSGITYLFCLVLANLAVAIPIALSYPHRSIFEEGLPIPSPSAQAWIYALGITITVIPQIATIGFGFMVSALSNNIATAIGVAVGILLSLFPLQVLIEFGNFRLSDWLVTNYYDKAMAIAGSQSEGMSEPWSDQSIIRLLLTSAITMILTVSIGFIAFTRRDLTE